MIQTGHGPDVRCRRPSWRRSPRHQAGKRDEHRRAIPGDMFVEHDARLGVAQQSRQRGLAIDKWAIAEKARARLSRRKERDWPCKEPRERTRRDLAVSFEGRSLPPAAAWSGYGCKPAERLTRSASLLMTHLRRQLCTATIEHLSDMCKRRRIPRPAIDVNRTLLFNPSRRSAETYGERGIVTTSCHSPQSQAWRRNVSGIAKGPLPFFWGSTRPFETPRGRRYSPASSRGIGPNRGADSNCLVRSWPGCVKTLTLFWKVEFASQFRSHRTQQRSQHLS